VINVTTIDEGKTLYLWITFAVYREYSAAIVAINSGSMLSRNACGPIG
jgi:hypothetical protein